MQTVALNSASTIPEQVKLSRTFDFNLEALRGFAAIVVIWHHIIEHPHWLDPHYLPNGIVAFNPPGHLSVLVFFVLSGYVIGRAHPLAFKRQDIIPYLKKRFIRLYPIYFISVLAAVIVAKNNYSVAEILGNLAMLQNFLMPVIFEVNPAWSLNFEVLFYLLLIPLSFFRLNAFLVALLFLILGIVGDITDYRIAAGYALGFVFWLCGVLLAKRSKTTQKPSFSLMISMLFLLLSLVQFNTISIWLATISKAVGLKDDAFHTWAIPLADFSYLPYCIVAILIFANIKFPYRTFSIFILTVLPAITFYRSFSVPEVIKDESMALPACFYVLALFFYIFQNRLENISASFIRRFSATGSLSYGLYMIHFPVVAIFSRIDWFSGNAVTFSLRFLCYVFLCFIAAYILEKKFQPWVKQLFY